MASRKYRLHEDESAVEGVRRVIAGRLEKAAERLRETGAADGDLGDAVHGARKDLKKARAALRTVRAELGPKTFRRESRRLRDAARLLAASRDAEVKLETLDTLVAEADGIAPPAALRIWRYALLAERDRVAAGSAPSAGPGRSTGDPGLDDQMAQATWAIEASLAAVPALKLRHGGWRLLEPGIDRAYRDGRDALRATCRKPSADAVHEWRKRAKDLWYQLRLLEAAWPGVLGASATELHWLTELLGEHHDLAVLAEDLEGRAEIGTDSAGTFAALIERRQAALLAEALGLGERVYAEKPKAFERRLRAYWRAWRRPRSA
jgi:CHAD domain-containing protein